MFTGNVAIPAGYAPDSIAVTPDGTHVVVADGDSEQATVTGRRGPAVSVGSYSYPTAMTFTGSTAVVLDTYGGQISLFRTGTRHAYPPITAGDIPSHWPSRADPRFFSDGDVENRRLVPSPG